MIHIFLEVNSCTPESGRAYCVFWICCIIAVTVGLEVAERFRMTASTCWRRITVSIARRHREARGSARPEKLGLSVMVFSHLKVAGHGRDAC